MAPSDNDSAHLSAKRKRSASLSTGPDGLTTLKLSAVDDVRQPSAAIVGLGARGWEVDNE
jgi:hypothetical protein